MEIATALLFSGIAVTSAQDGLPVIPGGSGSASTLFPQASAELPGEESTALTGIPNLETPQLLPYGIAFNLSTGMTYDDNIYRIQQDKTSATAVNAQAGFAWAKQQSEIFSMGLNYNVSGSTYLDLDSQNSVDQGAGLSAGLNLPRTQFTLSANYRHATGANRPSRRNRGVGETGFDDGTDDLDEEDPEVGPLEGRDIISTSLAATRKLGDRTGLTASLSNNQRLYNEADRQSTKNLSGRLGLNYSLTDYTTAGLAGVASYEETDRSPKSFRENIMLTASHTVTERSNFSGEAGLSFRQYEGDEAASNDVGFVFSLDYSYRIGEKTSLSLSASRNTGGSAVVRAAAVERTNFDMGLGHQVTPRVSLNLSGGYSFSSYGSTLSTEEVNREDDLWDGGIGLNYALSSRSSLGFSYNHRRRVTSSDESSYDSNQIGVNIGIRF